MIEIKKKEDCCGCSACRNACPVQCIEMRMDEEGFLFPEIDKKKVTIQDSPKHLLLRVYEHDSGVQNPIGEADSHGFCIRNWSGTEQLQKKCIGCGACERACPMIEKEPKKDTEQEKIEFYETPRAIGGWIKDEKLRYDSSSGGAFTLFARAILKRRGIVYGAAMDADLHVRHIGVENEADLARLRGSKYVQSEIGECYREIREQLKKGRYVLFSGTPCQAAGLYSYLGQKHYPTLYSIDFICHGVPSPKVFADYMDYMSDKLGEPVTYFRFRMKDRQWNPTGLQLGTGTGTGTGLFVRHFPGFMDPYMNGFLDDTYLRLSCYQCRFKTLPKYYADITIADFWGVNQSYPELYDGKGTSLVLFHNSHGTALFEENQEEFHYQEVDFETAIRRNKSLIKSVKLPARRERFFRDYPKKSFQSLMLRYMSPFSWGFHKACSMGWGMLEALIRKLLTPILKLLGQTWEEKAWEGFFQFVRFAMVGASNVCVSYAINVATLLLQRLLVPGFSYDYIVANTTAFLLSVLWSFYWNSRKVFRVGQTRGEVLHSLLRSYLSYSFSGIILNNLLGTFWIQVVGISKFIAPLLNLPITVPTNFFILKKWAFKEKKDA